MRFIREMGVFVKFPSNSRTIATIAVFVILIAIPLTVIIAQQQQELRQRAADHAICSNTNIPNCNNITQIPGAICDGSTQYCKIYSQDYDDDYDYKVYECKEE